MPLSVVAATGYSLERNISLIGCQCREMYAAKRLLKMLRSECIFDGLTTLIRKNDFRGVQPRSRPTMHGATAF